MNKDNTPACPECGGLRGGHSNYRCSLMTLEYAQQTIIDIEQRYIKILSGHVSTYQKTYWRLKDRITALAGKVSMLKHENNQLRKKP